MIAVRLVLVAALALAAGGCAGGACDIHADGVRYPVSVTRSVVNPDKRVVTPRAEQHVGRFSSGWQQWTLLWTLLPLTRREQDISELLEREIESRSGNGVVNFTVRVREDWFWYLSSLVPLWPTFVSITVEGDVVKL